MTDIKFWKLNTITWNHLIVQIKWALARLKML